MCRGEIITPNYPLSRPGSLFWDVCFPFVRIHSQLLSVDGTWLPPPQSTDALIELMACSLLRIVFLTTVITRAIRAGWAGGTLRGSKHCKQSSNRRGWSWCRRIHLATMTVRGSICNTERAQFAAHWVANFWLQLQHRDGLNLQHTPKPTNNVNKRPRTSGYSSTQCGGWHAFLFGTDAVWVSCPAFTQRFGASLQESREWSQSSFKTLHFRNLKTGNEVRIWSDHKKHFIHEDSAASPCLLEMGDRTSIANLYFCRDALQVGKIQNLPGESICGPQPLATKSEQYFDDNKKSDAELWKPSGAWTFYQLERLPVSVCMFTWDWSDKRTPQLCHNACMTCWRRTWPTCSRMKFPIEFFTL